MSEVMQLMKSKLELEHGSIESTASLEVEHGTTESTARVLT